MTPFVTPPTDNLYKFIAISGLVLMVVSIIAPLHFLRDFDKMPGADEAILKSEIIDEMVALRIGVDEKWAEAPLPGSTSKADVAAKRTSDDEFLQLLKSIQTSIHTRMYDSETLPPEPEFKALKQLRDKIQKLEIYKYSSWAFFEYFNQVNRWSDVGGRVSGWMILIGFTLWYRKVQRWHDRALVAEASKIPPPVKASRSLFSRLIAGARAKRTG